MFGLRKIAKLFGVSKITIQRIVNPEVAEKHKLYRKERNSLYYDPKKNTLYHKKHRRYKQDLYKKVY